jgi:uncharacterized protein (DUF2132 family)
VNLESGKPALLVGVYYEKILQEIVDDEKWDELTKDRIREIVQAFKIFSSRQNRVNHTPCTTTELEPLIIKLRHHHRRVMTPYNFDVEGSVVVVALFT